jgi:glycosyltransferase involved in cell wall biosynthesis
MAVDRLSARIADEVVAISSAVKHVLTHQDGVPEPKISLVPLGFDWDRIREAPGTGHRVRQELGVGEGPLLCCVGRLDPLKGHRDLFRAFASAGLDQAARLLIVGAGPEEACLRGLARCAGIADRCVFMGYRRDVYDIMSAANVVVNPSLSEAQNQVIIEALALARPVVATDVGAASEVVVPGATGWLVPAADPDALAQSLHDALSNPDRANSWARDGQRRVRALYPIDRMIDAYDSIYRRRIGSRIRAQC